MQGIYYPEDAAEQIIRTNYPDNENGIKNPIIELKAYFSMNKVSPGSKKSLSLQLVYKISKKSSNKNEPVSAQDSGNKP
jgi:hypothetical protein